MDLTKIALGAGAGFVIAKILDENLGKGSSDDLDDTGSDSDADSSRLSLEEREAKVREDHERFFEGQEDWKNLKDLAILVEFDDVDNIQQDEIVDSYEKLKEAVLIIHGDDTQENLAGVYFLDNLQDDIQAYTDPNDPSETAQLLYENIEAIQDEISSGASSDELEEFINTQIIDVVSQ